MAGEEAGESVGYGGGVLRAQEMGEAGRIAPDTRLPSEVDLSQQYGVARMTVRRAVAQLRDLGLVVTVHGRGSFAAPANDQAQG